MNIAQFLEFLAEYRIIFILLLDILLIVLAVIMGRLLINRFKIYYEDKNKEENALTLKNIDYSKISEKRKASIIRQIVSADAVDPGANGYLIINDGGVDVYIRNFTIASMPRRITFNETFKGLLNFPSCTSSIHVEPIPSSEMSRKLDRQVVILESEHYAAEGNTNRQRKLESQFREIDQQAQSVESGDESFFYVSFVFSIKAESIEKLNRLCDEFHAVAKGKKICIASCYGVQAEAYESNAPLNNVIRIGSKFIGGEVLQKFCWNRRALSALYNYTESSFSHKNGIPLGRNLFTRDPFVFDIYDPSHDGFLICMAGKTGSGKSVTIKVMCERAALQGYRFVAIDSQARKGTSEGEYAALAEILNGVNYQISSRTKNILNPYHVEESLVYIKETATTGYEQRTLELSDKISLVNSIIRTMMSAGKEITDDKLNVYLDRIISDANLAVYNDLGIYDKQPDSLYEIGSVVIGGKLSSGLVPKKLPAVTDFYKKVLMFERYNRDPALNEAFRIIVYGMKDWVRELYYSKDSVVFFTAEEYQALPSHPTKPNVKIYYNRETDDEEEVIEVHGIYPYFDGQNTIALSKDCPFTNIDISQQPEKVKKVTREIALAVVNEQFIKKNSESIHAADKLVVICDEAHEIFKMMYGRITLEGVARTARKRNVGVILSTQTIKEYDYYEETQDILKQAAAKFIFKQDAQDDKYLKATLKLTDAQVNLLTNYIGYSEEDDIEVKNKHRGEMCVIDSNKVLFVKVDMIKATEALSAETSAAEIEKLYKVG